MLFRSERPADRASSANGARQNFGARLKNSTGRTGQIMGYIHRTSSLAIYSVCNHDRSTPIRYIPTIRRVSGMVRWATSQILMSTKCIQPYAIGMYACRHSSILFSRSVQVILRPCSLKSILTHWSPRHALFWDQVPRSTDRCICRQRATGNPQVVEGDA